MQEDIEATISVSYVELAEDSISDLLVDGGRGGQALRIVNALGGGTEVAGAVKATVQSEEEALRLYFEGEGNRMRDCAGPSTTSHCIFTMELMVCWIIVRDISWTVSEITKTVSCVAKALNLALLSLAGVSQ